MEKQPYLGTISGEEAMEQLRRYPHPQETGVLHIPEQGITWPMLVPQEGISLVLDPASDKQLTYGMVTGLIAFEDTFHLLGRVDYAYGDDESTALFRLDWGPDKDMMESIAELGILVLSAQTPPKFADKNELLAYLSSVPTFVCELDAQELHRLRIQQVRMNAQAQWK